MLQAIRGIIISLGIVIFLLIITSIGAVGFILFIAFMLGTFVYNLNKLLRSNK